jgi:hypothetical protein
VKEYWLHERISTPKRSTKLVEAGEDWVDKDAAANVFEETKKDNPCRADE